MFQPFLTVALNTVVETIRQPIYSVLIFATAVLLVINVSLAAFTLADDNKLLLDLGLSTLLLSGLFLSAFSASSVLGKEIENKTVLTVISKPISRPIFVLGKFAGLMAAIGLAYYLGTLVFILTVRHGVLQNSSDPWDGPVLVLGCGSLIISLIVGAFCNFFYDKDFPATTLSVLAPLLTLAVLVVGKFDEHWEVIPFGSNYVGGQVVLAAFLVFLTVTVTAAVALAASTRFGQLMTLVICVAVLGLGIVSDSALGPNADKSTLASLVYHAVPNVGPFWVIDGLRADSPETLITGSYIAYTSLYALLLTTAILSIAVAAFQKREVG